MKLSRVFVLLASAGLAACGSGKPEGSVAFHGIPANTSKQQERLKQAGTIRDYTLACPQCGTAANITLDTKICPKKKTCGASMFFPDEYVCASCKGTGLCTACVWMDQMPTGECYNCRGKGDLIFNGQARDCPNCKGRKDAPANSAGKCPICEGTKKCDWCKAEKQDKQGRYVVSKDFVKLHLRKGGGGDEEPEPVKKAEEKKPEEKKTDEKKPDEKPSEEKK